MNEIRYMELSPGDVTVEMYEKEVTMLTVEKRMMVAEIIRLRKKMCEIIDTYEKEKDNKKEDPNDSF